MGLRWKKQDCASTCSSKLKLASKFLAAAHTLTDKLCISQHCNCPSVLSSLPNRMTWFSLLFLRWQTQMENFSLSPLNSLKALCTWKRLQMSSAFYKQVPNSFHPLYELFSHRNSGQCPGNQVWIFSGVAPWHMLHTAGDCLCQMCSHSLEIICLVQCRLFKKYLGGNCCPYCQINWGIYKILGAM